MDEVTWTALAAVLTAVGAAWTWYAFRHRGVASGLRGAGLTLLPPAAWLTGTLEMFTEIGGSVAGWATGLVLNPFTWVGIVLAGLAVLLLGSSSVLRSRELGGRPDTEKGAPASRQPRRLPSSSDQEPAVDDELADIEEILRRRGIS